MSACRRATDIYIFIMLSVFPLYTGLSGYADITDSKFFFFAFCTLLWLAALVVCGIVSRVKTRNFQPLAHVEIAAVGFAAICCISALLSDFSDSVLLGAGRWDGLLTWLIYIAIFLGVRRFGQLREVHLYGLGASLLLCTFLAVLQLTGRDPLGLFPGNLTYYDAHIRYSGEFLGTIGNVDLLAGYLCLCIPLLSVRYITSGKNAILLFPAAAGVFLLIRSGVAGGFLALMGCVFVSIPVLLRSRERLFRACLSGAALLFGAFWGIALNFSQTAVCLSTGSSAWLSLALCALCLLLSGILYLRREQPQIQPTQYTRRFLIILLILLAICLLALYFYPGESGTLHEFSRILHGEIDDSFGSSRILIWRETLSLTPERPLFGGGPGTLSLRLEIEFSRYVEETGNTLRSFVDNAHNMYLGILADIGIFGLLSYLSMMLLSAVAWLRRKDEASSMPTIGSAVLCYWIQDFFGLGLCLVAPVFWILWGLLCTTEQESQDAPEESSPQAESE